MLDGIRANAQSWAIKVAFGIIIIVFVFWGIGGPTAPKTVVATVNGINITEQEFRRAYQQMEAGYRSAFPEATPEMLKGLGLERTVLRQLAQAKLLEAESARTGIDVSAYDLRRVVGDMPAFRGPSGTFSKEAYTATLAANQMTPSQYEETLRQQLLPQKFMMAAGAGAYASPAEIRRLYNYQREQRRADYVLFSAESHKAAAAPSEEEITKAYEARAGRFSLPARLRLEYVLLNPTEMSKPELITDQAVAAAYEKQIAQFTLPERAHARHLLIRVSEKAPEADVKKAEAAVKDAEARIKGGEDFAVVAKAVGQDASAAEGGDLGWFARSQMVPAFADAAFALKPGEISAPVRSPFGFHLIKLEEREDARVRPLAEVKDELRQSMAVQAATTGLQDKVDAVLAAALGGKSMADAAAVAGVAAKDTELRSAEDVVQDLHLSAQDAKNVMGVKSGTVLDSPVVTDSGVLVIRVAESLPNSVRPLEEVRGELVTLLTTEKAVALAKAEAEKARALFADNKPGADLTAQVKKSELFDRYGSVLGLGPNSELVRALFEQPAQSADKGVWLPGAYAVEDGAVLVSLAGVAEPDDAAWAKEAPELEQKMQAARAETLFNMYQFLLEQGAKMEIRSPELLGQNAEPQS